MILFKHATCPECADYVSGPIYYGHLRSVHGATEEEAMNAMAQHGDSPRSMKRIEMTGYMPMVVDRGYQYLVPLTLITIAWFIAVSVNSLSWIIGISGFAILGAWIGVWENYRCIMQLLAMTEELRKRIDRIEKEVQSNGSEES